MDKISHDLKLPHDMAFDSQGWEYAGGRRRACKEQGLKGKALRECKKKLKAEGWKKGDPTPGADASPEKRAQYEYSKQMQANKKQTTTWLIAGISTAVVLGTIIFIVTRKKS